VQAICAGGEHADALDGGWRRNKAGAPFFEFWSGAGGRINVSINAANEDAWRDISSYSPLTLDAALGLLSCLAADPFRATTAAPRNDPVRLGAPAILIAKGYKRFGAERAAFADAIDSECAKLLRLRFELIKYPGFDPISRKWNSDGISRSGITLFERCEEAETRDAHDCARGSPYRFGAWSQHWLNAGGAMWVSPLPQAVLRFDHRENRGADPLAKKIAALLAINWGAARKNKEIRLEVRSLLRRVGELPRPGATQSSHPGRLADRLEEALMRLNETDILPNEFANVTASDLRAANRQWHGSWLEAEIVFSRPSYLEQSKTLR